MELRRIELRPIRVVHYGLGDIGSRIAQLTVAQQGIQVVGGIDRDPAKAGRDLAEVLGLDQPLGAPVSMLADGLGWQLDRITETIDPIVAEDWMRTPYLTIAPGQVAGLKQTAHGWLHGRDVLTLTWQTAVGARDTHDAIVIDGTPPVDLLIRGGLHGDRAAAALILHAIPRVLAAPPGLTTVLALPPIHYQPRPEPEQYLRARSR